MAVELYKKKQEAKYDLWWRLIWKYLNLRNYKMYFDVLWQQPNEWETL